MSISPYGETEDTVDLKSIAARRGGSTPSTGTRTKEKV